MIFNEAIEALKEGHAIRRATADWGEKTYYYSFDNRIKLFCEVLGGDYYLDGLIGLSVEDLYADDWEIAEYVYEEA